PGGGENCTGAGPTCTTFPIDAQLDWLDGQCTTTWEPVAESPCVLISTLLPLSSVWKWPAVITFCGNGSLNCSSWSSATSERSLPCAQPSARTQMRLSSF